MFVTESAKVSPVQSGPLDVGCGVVMVTETQFGIEVQPAPSTLTQYCPAPHGWIFAMVGFWFVNENPFGPDQL
jgi:hypothetical protein